MGKRPSGGQGIGYVVKEVKWPWGRLTLAAPLVLLLWPIIGPASLVPVVIVALAALMLHLVPILRTNEFAVAGKRYVALPVVILPPLTTVASVDLERLLRGALSSLFRDLLDKVKEMYLLHVYANLFDVLVPLEGVEVVEESLRSVGYCVVLGRSPIPVVGPRDNGQLGTLVVEDWSRVRVGRGLFVTSSVAGFRVSFIRRINDLVFISAAKYGGSLSLREALVRMRRRGALLTQDGFNALFIEELIKKVARVYS